MLKHLSIFVYWSAQSHVQALTCASSHHCSCLSCFRCIGWREVFFTILLPMHMSNFETSEYTHMSFSPLYLFFFVFIITHAPQARVHALVQLLTLVDVAAGTRVPPSRRPWLQRRSQGEGQGKNWQLLLFVFHQYNLNLDLPLNLAPP